MKQSESVTCCIRCVLICLMMIFLCGFHWWDPLSKWVERGNSALEKGDMETAGQAYDDAGRAVPGDERIMYNKALLAYLQERYDDAADLFDRAGSGGDSVVKFQSLYNKGCTYMQKGALDSAAEAFIEALGINPENEDAKINLEIVRRLMEQIPTPTPTPQPPETSSDDQDQGDDQDQENDQENDPEESSDDDSTVNDNDEQTDPPEPTPAPSPETPDSEPSDPEPMQDGMMSPSEAQRLLDAQQQEEMDVLRRLHQLPQAIDIDRKW